MQINLNYTIALNILITCYIYDKEKITANFIVQKTGGDGTTIREVMFKLKTAGFITNKPGPGGTKLSKDLNNVSLYDVYAAVLNPKNSILKFYDATETNKDVSLAIQNIVEKQFNEYRNLFFNEMRKTSVAQLCEKIKSTI